MAMDDQTVKMLFEKLESIEKKVDREIHGGNGKGLWEESREIKQSVDAMETAVQELSIKLNGHTSQHLGRASAEDVARKMKNITIAIIGLGITALGTLAMVITVLSEVL